MKFCVRVAGEPTRIGQKLRGGLMLSALLSCINAEAAPAQDLGQFVASVPRANYATNRLIARDLRAESQKVDLANEALRAENMLEVAPVRANDLLKVFASPDLPRMHRSMRTVLEGYEHRKRRATFASGLLAANNFAVGTIVATSLAAAPATLGGSIALGSFAAVSAAGLNVVTSEFRKQQEEAARAALAASIQGYVRERGLDDLEGLQPNEVLDRLEAGGHPVLDRNLAGLRDDPAALAIADHVTMQVLAKTDLEILRNLEVSEARAEKTRQELSGLSQTFTAFARQTNTQFAKLNATVESITADLVSVNERVSQNKDDILKNREDIEFLQESMFGKMDPSEQIALISAGGLDHLPQERQEYLLDLASKAEKRRELLEDVGNFVNGASGIVEIAKNLGVDVPEEVALAVGVANQANQALSALATGNYIGAIVSITGVFGKQGPDAATLRHQQIMSALHDIQQGIGRLERGQAEIMNMINGLAQNQARMMENQQRIFEAVLDLSEQVAESHQVLFERLERLGRAVTVNLEGIMALRWELMDQCLPFRTSREQAVTIGGRLITEPFVNGEFINYNALSHHFHEFKPYLKDCLTGLRRNLATIGDPNNIFAMKFYQSDDTDAETNAQIDHFITNVYAPALELLLSGAEKQMGSPQSRERAFASLTAPAATASGLKEKIKSLKTQDSPLPDRVHHFVNGIPLGGAAVPELMTALKPRSIASLMRTPLVLENLDYALGNLIDLHWYHDILRDVGTMNDLLPLEDLLEREEPAALGRDLVLRGILVTDLAVAQQSMLSGDLMAPIVHDAIISNQGDPAGFPREIEDLLRASPALASNVLLWGLKQEGRVDPAGQAYFIALHSSTPDLLQAQFGSLWKFQKDDDGGWYAEIGGIAVPLPTVERFATGAFAIPQNLQALIDLRARLVEEYLGYDLLNAVHGRRREDLGRFIIGGI